MSLLIRDFKVQVNNVSCDFCRGEKFIFFSDKMRHNINLSTVICSNCGLVQTNPQPSLDSIQEFYDKFYHLFHKRKGVDDAYLARSKRMAEKRFKILSRFTADQKHSLLEIGPGAGEFMIKINRDANWETEGIEPGTESYEWCVGKNLNVKNALFENFEFRKRYTSIVSFHVLEHVLSPGRFLDKCFDLLEERGLLYLEVPNFHRPGQPYNEFLQFPHLYNFTGVTLCNYLQTAGFKPIFIDESVANLTVISRKGKKEKNTDNDFVKTDLTNYVPILNRKNRFYKLARKIPAIPILSRVKYLLNSLY